LKISYDYYPKTEIVYRDKKKELPEIPTIPGAFESLVQRLSDIPMKELVEGLNETAAGIASIANSGKLEATLDGLDKTMKDISILLSGISGGSGDMLREIKDALEEFSDASRSARFLLDYLERHPDALLYGKGKDQ